MSQQPLQAGETTVEAAVRTLLITDPGVVGMIGYMAGGVQALRYYPLKLPPPDPNVPNPLPATVYAPGGLTDEYTLTGPGGAPEVRLTMTHWGNDFAQSRAVARVVKNRLAGFKGQVGDVYIMRIKRDNQFTNEDPTTKKVRTLQDWLVRYQEL